MAKIDRLISANMVILVNPVNSIDLRFIDPQGLRNIAKLEEDPYGSTVFQGPEDIKVVMPQRKISIVISSTRIQVTDDYPKNPEDSDLITRYLTNVLEILPSVDSIAYGFNYLFTVIVGGKYEPLNSDLYKSLPKSKLIVQGCKLRSIADDKTKYQLNLDQNLDQKDKNIYVARFNMEIEGVAELEKIIDDKINNQFIKGYKTAGRVINAIE